MLNVDNYPKTRPLWQHYRVIHSRFPPKNMFDTNDHDAFLLAQVESSTNDRLFNWSNYIAAEDFNYGDGWGALMASFCYPREGRFSTDNRGAYYCAKSIETAIKEWSFHTAKFWHSHGWTNEVSAVVRSYTGRIVENLIDVRGEASLHHPSDYSQSILFSDQAYLNKAHGIAYQSVRHPGSECLALLRPTASTPVKQSAHYTLIFNGQSFESYAKLGELKKL